MGVFAIIDVFFNWLAQIYMFIVTYMQQTCYRMHSQECDWILMFMVHFQQGVPFPSFFVSSFLSVQIIFLRRN